MKIIYDYQIFSFQKFGGISRYIYEIANHIATKNSRHVNIICPLYTNKYLRSSKSLAKVSGFFININPKFLPAVRFINQLASWVILKYVKPEIIHETYYSAMRLTSKKTKIILTVHDMIHERFKDKFSPLDTTMKKKAIAVSRADHIICVSENTKRDLIELLGVNPSKISVVYLGFNLTSNIKSKFKIDKKARPFLFYVGARDGYKNFKNFLRAYSQSKNLKKNFDIVCFGGGPFVIEEINLINKLNVNVNSIRQVSGGDEILGDYYKRATALIYPSLYEGFGIPPLEAMGLGCPVLCSNVSSIPEVVGDAAIMFNPADVLSIQIAIEGFVNDFSLRDKMINLGRERVKIFSWERCAKETLQIYDKVLKLDKEILYNKKATL